MSQLRYAPNTLLVFVDDTGHETLNGQRFYGLGGCAVLGQDYERLVAGPWTIVRLLLNNDGSAPLHAAEFGPRATRSQLEEVASFFRQNHFMRIGAAGAATTALPDDIELAFAVLGSLKERIVDVARWTPFDSISVIFEDNPRANDRVQRYFGDFAVSAEAGPVPVQCFFMPKSANEPGLEVADFIANAIGGHARHTLLDGRTGARLDFQAVFQGLAPRLVSYIGITNVALNAPQMREGHE